MNADADRLYYEEYDDGIAELWKWSATEGSTVTHYLFQSREIHCGVMSYPYNWHIALIDAETDAEAIREAIKRVDGIKGRRP